MTGWVPRSSNSLPVVCLSEWVCLAPRPDATTSRQKVTSPLWRPEPRRTLLPRGRLQPTSLCHQLQLVVPVAPHVLFVRLSRLQPASCPTAYPPTRLRRDKGVRLTCFCRRCLALGARAARVRAADPCNALGVLWQRFPGRARPGIHAGLTARCPALPIPVHRDSRYPGFNHVRQINSSLFTRNKRRVDHWLGQMPSAPPCGRQGPPPRTTLQKGNRHPTGSDRAPWSLSWGRPPGHPCAPPHPTRRRAVTARGTAGRPHHSYD